MHRLFIPSIVANGILWLVGVAVQIGGWVNQAIAITLLVIAFLWTLASVVYWLRNRNKKWQTKSEKGEVSVKVETILIRIHKRMLELKDKAARQYYLKHSFKEFLDLLNDLEGTIGKDTGLEDIRKGLRGKKLSKDRGKKRAQIDNLLDQVKPTLPMDWSLDALIKFVNKFNRLAQTPGKRYEGLDTLRDKDKRWAKLFGELQIVKTEFNDALLNKMIDEYIDWSYGCSGLSLLSDLFRHIRAEILPTEYLESEAFRPSIEVENTMTQLRGEIINRIKELQINSEPTNAKRLVVSVEPQTGDPSRGAIWRHLRVTNLDAEPIDECYGLLVSFHSANIENDSKCPPSGFYYPWSSYGGRGKKTKIGGRGGFDKLDIAVVNWPGDAYRDTLLTPELFKDGYNRQMIYPLPKGIYFIEIQIGSTAVAFQPINIKLKLTFDGGANLHIEELSNTSKP
jgi:hypothetical protein